MDKSLIFDLITLGLILILAFKGMMNGIIKEIFGLIGIIGGIYIGMVYGQQAGVWVDKELFVIGNKSSLFIVGFFIVLTCFWILSILLGILFSKLVKLSGLGVLDKLIGFVIGALKFFLVFSVMFWALSHVQVIKEKMDEYLSKSFMYPIFYKAGDIIVPEQTMTDVFAKMKKVSKKINQNISIDINKTVDKEENVTKKITIEEVNSSKEN